MKILKREKSEAIRYKKYYNIDVSDTSIYDVIIDVGDKTPEQIMENAVREPGSQQSQQQEQTVASEQPVAEDRNYTDSVGQRAVP